MKEITQELKAKIQKDVEGFAGELRKEGMTDDLIGVAIQNYARNKLKNYYRMQDPYYMGLPYQNTKGLVLKILNGLDGADSKAEAVFYRLLVENKVPFKFQVEIGPYRVDYLIGGVIIFEGDGPHHDQQTNYDALRDEYLEKQGYEVMRMKWNLVAILGNEVIYTIQNRLREYKII